MAASAMMYRSAKGYQWYAMRNDYFSPLWKIGKADSDCILFGTVHITHPSLHPWVELALNTLENCEAFYAELDLDQMNQMQGIQWGDHDLKEALGGQYDKKLAFAKRVFHIDLDRMRHLHPFWINTILAQSLMAQNYSESQSMDQTLWSSAQELGMACGGLENIEDHIQIIKDLDTEEQYRQIKMLLRNPHKQRKRFRRLIELYAQGDLPRLYKLSRSGLGSLRTVMINRRNASILQSMLSYMDGQSCFFAVGVAHLYGEFGLLRRLKHLGYELTPVTPQASVDH